MINNRSIRFFAAEKITFIYIAVTFITILFLIPEIQNVTKLLGYRLIFVGLIVLFAYYNSQHNWWIIKFLRFAFLGALIPYWYPETFEINRALPNFDFLLANWEQNIFGFQPALLFCQAFPEDWICEVLNLGYFAFYPLIIGSSIFFFFTSRKYFNYFFFTILFAFLFYFLIFILFPTAGPQYYYSAIGLENVKAGLFPPISHYFNNNQVLLPNTHDSGFFYRLVETTQQLGERPTAAFPSSHVGISTLIMILFAKNKHYFVFALILPLYCALVAATVYIQAHYLIDVYAGFVMAFVLYFLSNYVYQLFTKKYFGISELNAIFLKEVVQSREV